jgi:thiol-disulfide isomerase/thioredoxin
MTRRSPGLHRIAEVVSVLCALAVLAACGNQPAATAAQPNNAAAASASASGFPSQPSAAASAVPGATSSAAPKRSATSTVTTRAPKPVGKLGFTARTVGGADFNGASVAGRPVVLWFWAPWCPLCDGQAPEVKRVATKYSGKVAVIGVAGMSKTNAMKEFVARNGVSGFTNLADESGAVWRRFGVTEQGRYVLLDASGTVVYTGYLDGDALAERVGRLVR